LSDADLKGAYLDDAYIEDTYLNDAYLSSARGLTTDKLERQAKSLEGATMPDGAKHD
jgi:uncharacterized protein YjbI with pentapeptide repeats